MIGAPVPDRSAAIDTAAAARPQNLLTIDVEDYFHASGLEVAEERWDQLPGRVEYTTRRLLELLGRRNVQATFFVLGWVASRYPTLVREIHEAGHEIASHGWRHQLVYDLDPQRFRDDVVRAKDLLEGLTGERVLGYRAPSFSIVPRSRWAIDVLIETGHLYDSSVFPIARGRYGDPDSPRHVHAVTGSGDERESIFEVPPSTLPLLGRNVPVAGGGYFRAFPLWFTRWALNRLNAAEQMPAVVYLHPWEVDPDQPHMPASRGNRFRHYLNLGRTESRLMALLDEYDFGTVRSWLDLPVIAAPAVKVAPVAARRSA